MEPLYSYNVETMTISGNQCMFSSIYEIFSAGREATNKTYESSIF